MPTYFTFSLPRFTFLIAKLLCLSQNFLWLQDRTLFYTSKKHVGVVVLCCWSPNLSSIFLSPWEGLEKSRCWQAQASCQLVHLSLHGLLLFGVTVQVRFRVCQRDQFFFYCWLHTHAHHTVQVYTNMYCYLFW